MRILKLVIFLTMLSCIQVCPATKKRLRISKRSRVTLKQEKQYNRRHYRSTERTKVCSPDAIKATAKIGSTLIQGVAIIIAAVLKAVIER